MLEIRASILAPSWQEEGIITDFGTLAAGKRRVPYQWKKVRDITATWTETSSGAEAVLVNNDQQVYIPTFDHAPAAPNCPTNYWWMETKEPKVRVARQVGTNPDNDRQFPELPADEAVPAASTDP